MTFVTNPRRGARRHRRRRRGLGVAALLRGLPARDTTPAAASCVLAPEQTEGPCHVDGALVRRTITDGRLGVPLRLRLTVVDATTCRPLEGATVEIWHADALGVYSGFGEGASSRTFLRARSARTPPASPSS